MLPQLGQDDAFISLKFVMCTAIHLICGEIVYWGS